MAKALWRGQTSPPDEEQGDTFCDRTQRRTRGTATGFNHGKADNLIWQDIARLERENDALRVLLARLAGDKLAFH